MAATYNLINSQTMTGTTATCSFTNISGYTDLILKTNFTLASGGDAFVRFNSDTGTYLFLSGTTGNTGSQVFTSAQSNSSSIPVVGSPNSQQSSSNANSFELGIPSYTGGNTKNGYSMFSYVTDSSAPRANTGVGAWQWRNTAAITSIQITGTSNLNGSFSLYGILAGNA
jgi:hypothetical protein